MPLPLHPRPMLPVEELRVVLWPRCAARCGLLEYAELRAGPACPNCDGAVQLCRRGA
jgi:hypothetical protein